MYNTSPPDAPSTNSIDDLKDYAMNNWQYLTNMFRVGIVLTQLPNTSILEKMQANNDKGQAGKIFYVSDGTNGAYYRTKLEGGNLVYEEF